MAQEVVIANKVWNIETCKTTMDNQQLLETYCDNNVINDYFKNKDCKVKANFCYICCESEFWSAQFNNRAKCYDMCDEKEKAWEKNKDDEPRGDWIWKVNTN